MPDFILSVSTQEVAEEINIPSIKRELYHMLPWLSDYCKDRNLLRREYLPVETVDLIKFFTNMLKDDNRDIHDFAEAKLVNVDQFSTVIRFIAYRD